jgi:hypothetical protein
MLKNDSRSKILILTIHESYRLIREVLDVGTRARAEDGCEPGPGYRDQAVRGNKTFFIVRVAKMVLVAYLDKNPTEGPGALCGLQQHHRAAAKAARKSAATYTSFAPGLGDELYFLGPYAVFL